MAHPLQRAPDETRGDLENAVPPKFFIFSANGIFEWWKARGGNTPPRRTKTAK
jgi:hypothetical protein